MKADLNRAVEDLNFLSNRFAGIISLKDNLTALGDLNNQISSLERVLAPLKDSVTKLQEEKRNLDQEIQKNKIDLDAYIKDTEKKGQEILSEAKRAASIDKSVKEQESLVTINKAKREYALILEEIDKAKKELILSQKETQAEQQRLQAVKNEIAKIKENI